MNDAVKPCPFCGKQPEVFPSGDGTGVMIECMTDGCVGPCTSYYGDGVAIKVWNRRTPPAGWKLVPIEPTDHMNMVEAGENALFERGAEGSSPELAADAVAAYKAMLSAAPENEP